MYTIIIVCYTIIILVCNFNDINVYNYNCVLYNNNISM